MGMDLIPLNPRQGGFHCNFTGWRFIREVLELLGADTSAMSGRNDGDVISRETAQDWAARMQKALESRRLRITSTPDPSYMGGERSSPSLTHGVPVRSQHDGSWLQEVADFFERSGGFQQY